MRWKQIIKPRIEWLPFFPIIPVLVEGKEMVCLEKIERCRFSRGVGYARTTYTYYRERHSQWEPTDKAYYNHKEGRRL